MQCGDHDSVRAFFKEMHVIFYYDYFMTRIMVILFCIEDINVLLFNISVLFQTVSIEECIYFNQIQIINNAKLKRYLHCPIIAKRYCTDQYTTSFSHLNIMSIKVMLFYQVHYVYFESHVN